MIISSRHIYVRFIVFTLTPFLCVKIFFISFPIHVAASSVPPTSGTSTDSSYQQANGAMAPPPPAPWQQAPLNAPPQGQVPGWQQPLMYGNVPAPLPSMGVAPPLPPGTAGAPGAPPPPPPEQNWVRLLDSSVETFRRYNVLVLSLLCLGCRSRPFLRMDSK